jgi:hypothetical protein
MDLMLKKGSLFLSRAPVSAMIVGAAICAILFAVSGSAIAQEGHPLTGSWHGSWGADAATAAKSKDKSTAGAHPIVMAMKWNNKDVDATLSPGRNSVPMKVTLNPADWTVHMEADTKDGKHVVADGKLGDIGSYHRTITGTWTQGSEKGSFKITRD